MSLFKSNLCSSCFFLKKNENGTVLNPELQEIPWFGLIKNYTDYF